MHRGRREVIYKRKHGKSKINRAEKKDEVGGRLKRNTSFVDFDRI